MAWSLLHTDTFDRADAELNGATMSDGVGAWTVVGGTGVYSVASNDMFSNAGSWSVLPAYDSVMSSTQGDQAAEMVVVTTSPTAGVVPGPVTRWTGGGSPGTYYWLTYDGANLLVYRASGSFPGTQIFSVAASLSAGDVLRLESVGNVHEVFLNGTSKGTATDSNYTTGRCGVWCAFSHSAGTFSDYVPAASSSIKTVDGLAIASVKTVDGLAIASVKTWNGLA